MATVVKFGDVKDDLVGKTVSFPVGVDKDRQIVVQRVIPWREGKEQVYYQKGRVSLIANHETDVTIYE